MQTLLEKRSAAWVVLRAVKALTMYHGTPVQQLEQSQPSAHAHERGVQAMFWRLKMESDKEFDAKAHKLIETIHEFATQCGQPRAWNFSKFSVSEVTHGHDTFKTPRPAKEQETRPSCMCPSLCRDTCSCLRLGPYIEGQPVLVSGCCITLLN